MDSDSHSRAGAQTEAPASEAAAGGEALHAPAAAPSMGPGESILWRRLSAGGIPTPDNAAETIAAYPHERHRIVLLLQRRLGNRFVQETIAAGHKAPQASVAPHAMMMSAMAPKPEAPLEEVAPATSAHESYGMPLTSHAMMATGISPLESKQDELHVFDQDMQQVAAEYTPKFTPLGLHFRPEILLATTMQEAAAKDPANTRSFDNGLGLMQITPFRAQLDPGVAKAIGWDNSQSLEFNIRNSQWRNARANITAGAEVMLGKAHAIARGVPGVWAEMDEDHRWRAVMYAYNAGEGNALKALRTGGPDADMISTFRRPDGEVVSHDYTAEMKARLDFVDTHDPFSSSPAPAPEPAPAPAPAPTPAPQPAPTPAPPAPSAALRGAIHASVGLQGANHPQDVMLVQTKLQEQGVYHGPINGVADEPTLHAIQQFQREFMHHPDDLIAVGKTTSHHLFPKLQDSVGSDGTNHPRDVRIVQTTLREHGVYHGPITGIMDQATIQAIVQFQRGFTKDHDGLIEVGKNTARHLFS